MNTAALCKELKDPFANGSVSSNQLGEGDSLATLRDSLLPELLSGELSVAAEP